MDSRKSVIRAFRFIISLVKPPPDVSWITSSLAVGGTLLPRQFKGLAQMGIQAVVDLREEGRDDERLLAQNGIRLLHLPVRDYWPPSQDQLKQADTVLWCGVKVVPISGSMNETAERLFCRRILAPPPRASVLTLGISAHSSN